MKNYREVVFQTFSNYYLLLPGALTSGSNRLIIQTMKRGLLILIMLLSACAVKPPVQEMSNARSAIKAAQELPGSTPKSESYLKSAETALEEAVEAIRQERYETARGKAMEAKRNAQTAAHIKQSNKHH